MAEKVIFAEQTITGFELNSSYSCYLKSVRPSPFVLEDGKTYRITWDDDTDEYQAVTANVGGMDFVCVGNGAVIGGENNGKKFAMGYNTATGFMNFFALEAGESHRVAIYQIVEDEETETGSTIVLRDRNGNPVEYPGIERVKLNTTSGETVEFVSPSLIPESVETIIDPDFSGGNIEVTPEDGQAFSKVTVKQPENLIPSNIAEGVNIAGILGTLAASGGSGKVAYGVFQPTVSQPNTITHNLGVLPDIVSVFVSSSPYPRKNYTDLRFGVSEAFSQLNGNIASNRQYYTTSDYGDTKRTYMGTFIENTNTGKGYGITHANETSFTIRDNLDTYYKYFWIAIGGLT